MYVVYRKPDCPFGKKAVALLKSRNLQFEDKIFSSKEEEISFKTEHSVQTTPQIFLDGRRLGGYDSLAKIFGETEPETSYLPVIVLFGVTALTGIAMGTWLKGFMSLSLIFLATLKLMDAASFRNGFLKYDLLSPVFPFYARLFPYLELMIGLNILSERFSGITGLVSFAVGALGAASIYKAVYIEKKELKCACVGGGFDVPLGVVSLTENIFMIVMGLWLIGFGG